MQNHEPLFSAIIVAGGTGSRFSPTENKTTKLLHGLPVLEYSIQAFQQSEQVSEIIVVGDLQLYRDRFLADYPKITSIVPGGATRTESVKSGLKAMNPSAQYVFIHDAARPFVEPEFIDHMAKQIQLQHTLTGIFPVLPIYDSLKSMDKMDQTKPYSGPPLVRTQTPQLFRVDTLKKAVSANISLMPFRDESEMIQHYMEGASFLPIPGSYHLEKITTLQEWHLIENLIQKETCIGIGYDFHPFSPGRKLVLGGLNIPDEEGLEGDSDGDVYTHSILEALIGALSLGDMGSFFGIGTQEVMGKESTAFLQILRDHPSFQGVQIHHIDTTLVAKKPFLQPWIPEMIKNISQLLCISENQINIKSTTDKGLDAAGEGLGIRSISVVLLDKIRRSYAR